jgi:hypothetical protein
LEQAKIDIFLVKTNCDQFSVMYNIFSILDWGGFGLKSEN